ncbi:MAG: ferredoxin [Nitratireductor sp.]
MDELKGALAGRLAPLGLLVFGGFRIEPGDQTSVPELAGAPALLIGNAGGRMWEVFAASNEFCDGEDDPMNRWTQRVMEEVVRECSADCQLLFPFGEVVWPFQRFALRAIGVQQSPLGLFIHPQYGLWFALRAAIVFQGEGPAVERAIQQVEEPIHPCLDCSEKPCLTHCPVSAFSGSGFAVGACRSYLDSIQSSQTDAGLPDRVNCMDKGCAARNACPVGRDWRYGEAQLQFHMQAFKG